MEVIQFIPKDDLLRGYYIGHIAYQNCEKYMTQDKFEYTDIILWIHNYSFVRASMGYCFYERK